MKYKLQVAVIFAMILIVSIIGAMTPADWLARLSFGILVGMSSNSIFKHLAREIEHRQLEAELTQVMKSAEKCVAVLNNAHLTEVDK